MSFTQNTLLLDVSAWDLVADSSGNIAMASNPYSIAQDVASALRTFIGECWYDTGNGIPYWQNILGQLPPMPYVKSQMQKQALTVPNVIKATVDFSAFNNRTLQGDCKITDANGNQYTVEF